MATNIKRTPKSKRGIMKRNNSYLVFLELVLILASILMYRSVWLLLDRTEWMSQPPGLWAGLAAGVIVATVALVALNRCFQPTK